MIDVNYVDVYINGDNYQLMYYNNNFSEIYLVVGIMNIRILRIIIQIILMKIIWLSYESFRNLYSLLCSTFQNRVNLLIMASSMLD